MKKSQPLKLANVQVEIFSEFALRLNPLQPGTCPLLEQHGRNQTYGVSNDLLRGNQLGFVGSG